MREVLSEFYRPTDQEFDRLWENATFIADTNVLLNLFRFNVDTREDILRSFSAIKDRFWVPYTVAKEFNTLWRQVDMENRKSYDDIISIVRSSLGKLQTSLEPYARHPFIDVKSEKAYLGDITNTFVDRLEKMKSAHPSAGNQHDLFEEISNFIGDRIGSRIDLSEYDRLFSEAKSRYEKKIPPGFLDVKKDDRERYSDYIIWYEILRYSKNNSKDVILITDDAKDDWWWKEGGMTIGPRTELRAEFKLETGQAFYMYNSSNFIEHASKKYGLHLDKTSIVEVEKDQDKRASATNYILNRNLRRRLERNHKQYLESIKAAQAVVRQIGLSDLQQIQKVIAAQSPSEREALAELIARMREQMIDLQAQRDALLAQRAAMLPELAQWEAAHLSAEENEGEDDDLDGTSRTDGD